MAKIGFIGLARIGLPMAKNLIKEGHEIKGFDFSDEIMRVAEKAGIEPVKSIAEASSGVDVVISILPEKKSSEGVFLGDKGIIKNADPNTLLIDCSDEYALPDNSLKVAATKAGLKILDAPVSGGVVEAKGGALTIMATGNDKAFLEGEPYLRLLAKNLYHFRLTGGLVSSGNDQGKNNVIYKKKLKWHRGAIVLVFLFLGGNAILFAMIEKHITIKGEHLTLTYPMSEFEHKTFCSGSRMLGLDINGC